jgi:PEP-CTERM motif
MESRVVEDMLMSETTPYRAGLVVWLLTLSLMLVLISSPSNAAPIIYGMFGGLGGHANGDSSQDGSLALIDPNTGAVTVIGHPTGVSRLSGLAFVNGVLYGATQGNFPYPPVTPPSASALVNIDPTTGALISKVAITANGTAINIADLATQPGTGVLYGVQGPNDNLNGQGLLYTINPLTGVATLVGDTHSFFDSIAFAHTGTLYLNAADLDFATGNVVNPRLETLNPATAAILSTVTTTEFYGAFGIGPNGVLYAGNGDQHKLFRLNPVTGAETLIGDTGRTFVGDIDFFVPEPASLGLISLGGAVLGFFGWRRRRSLR